MRGLKGIHELSVQRQIEKGDSIRPSTGHKFNDQDGEEIYLEKLIKESGRSASYT
jgi:hypothetical protein